MNLSTPFIANEFEGLEEQDLPPSLSPLGFTEPNVKDTVYDQDVID